MKRGDNLVDFDEIFVGWARRFNYSDDSFRSFVYTILCFSVDCYHVITLSHSH